MAFGEYINGALVSFVSIHAIRREVFLFAFHLLIDRFTKLGEGLGGLT